MKSDFGIFMSRPETQGFAAQELLSCNLPMFVWDQKVNAYEDKKLSELQCPTGMTDVGFADTFEEFIDKFPTF